MTERPIFTVVAGPAGAGKSTILDALVGEAGLPVRRVVAHDLDPSALAEALNNHLSSAESFILETRLDTPQLASAVARAVERGWPLELIVVDVEHPKLLRPRARDGVIGEEELSQQRYRHHLPAAIDLARRVLLIDNSAVTPIQHVLTEADLRNDRSFQGPRWIADKVITPKLLRIASTQAMRQASAVAATGPLKPFLQVASVIGRPSRGLVLARSEHHALQGVGNALHVVHDLALLPLAGPALVQGAMAVIRYESSREREEERDRDEAERSADRARPELTPQERERAR